MKKDSAFSLIELSIVIVVIGALIVGILQGKTIVTKAKLHSAQNQTAQSPVAQISNLIAWWESTSDKSFDSTERVDGSTVSTWYDINPNSLVALNMTQSNSNYKPIYKTNIENGLPMLQFNNGSYYFNIPDGTVPYGNSNYSVFIVGKFSGCSGGVCDILASGTASTNQLNSFQYQYQSGGSRVIRTSWNNAAFGFVYAGVKDTHIYSFIYSNASGTKIFVDASQKLSDSSTARASTRVSNYLGSPSASTGLSGYIGEVIIFDRNLKTEERKGVEKYLSRKWGMKLS